MKKYVVFKSIILLGIIYLASIMEASPSPGVVDVAATHDAEQQLPVELEEILASKKKRPDCPLCDSSVFSYCTDKLLHDACCCLSSYETELPLQCKFADCSFLHSNSCQEHRLITACCCNQLFNLRKK